MNDREKWWESVRDIRASGTTWWWWLLNRNSPKFEKVLELIGTQWILEGLHVEIRRGNTFICWFLLSIWFNTQKKVKANTSDKWYCQGNCYRYNDALQNIKSMARSPDVDFHIDVRRKRIALFVFLIWLDNLLWKPRYLMKEYNLMFKKKEAWNIPYPMQTSTDVEDPAGGACGVMVIVIGNGHGDTRSNPGRDWWHFT